MGPYEKLVGGDTVQLTIEFFRLGAAKRENSIVITIHTIVVLLMKDCTRLPDINSHLPKMTRSVSVFCLLMKYLQKNHEQIINFSKSLASCCRPYTHTPKLISHLPFLLNLANRKDLKNCEQCLQGGIL